MLNRSGVPYMVAGSFAFQYYSGISRSTKDFDIFVRPRDVRRTLDVLSRAGFRAEVAFSHWLAKAYHGDKFIDVIFNSGNGVAEVDDEWFAHAVQEEVLGVPVKLSPAEEMIWSKSMIMERERYDGADVAHLLRHCSGLLNWDRLVRRFGSNWRILLAHLVLFGFIYPFERGCIPAFVMEELLDRLQSEMYLIPTAGRLCQGTLLSKVQYATDVERWGYEDARLLPLNQRTGG